MHAGKPSAGGRNSPGGAGSQRPREGGSVFPTPRLGVFLRFELGLHLVALGLKCNQWKGPWSWRKVALTPQVPFEVLLCPEFSYGILLSQFFSYKWWLFFLTA